MLSTNTTPTLSRPTYAKSCTLLALLAASAMLNAQTNTPAPSAANDEVIELTPFEVKASSTTGYVSSETLTGSRVATKIVDLPYSVNVINSDFFEDFAFFELGDNVGYISGFSDFDQGGSFNLRGFRSSVQLRDGFFRLGRYGTSNIDRIEVIKGPNAAVYGQTSPGGMVNVASKKPKKKNSAKASISIGEFGNRRLTGEVNRTFNGGNTNVLGILGYYQRNSLTPDDELTNKEFYFAAEHSFDETSKLLVSLESFSRKQIASNSAAPTILNNQGTTGGTNFVFTRIDPVTLLPVQAGTLSPTAIDDRIIGVAENLANLQQRSTNSYLNRGIHALNAIYSKRINRTLNLRVAGNYYSAYNENYNNNVAAGQLVINPTANTRVMQRGAQPEWAGIFEDGGGVQADLLAEFRLSDSIRSRSLVTLEFNDYYRYDPAFRVPGTAASTPGWTPIRNITINPELTDVTAPIQYYTLPRNRNGETLRRLNDNRVTILGSLLRQQLDLWNGRVLAFGSVRIDNIKYKLSNKFTNQFATDEVTEATPSLGFSVKAINNMRVFVNYSEGFFANAQTTTADEIIDNPDFESERAQGWDYGVKFSFFEERLNFTVNGYHIDRQNVQSQVPDPNNNGLLITVFEGSQLVRGVDFDLSWNVNDSLELGTSVGYIDSEITDLGNKTLSNGRPPQRIVPLGASGYVKYSFNQGTLKGLSINAGVRYTDQTPISNPDAGDIYAVGDADLATTASIVALGGAAPSNGTTYRVGDFIYSNNEWALKNPAFTLIDVGIRYKFSGFGKTDHTIGANVSNVLDEKYLRSNRNAGDPRTISATYTLSF